MVMVPVIRGHGKGHMQYEDIPLPADGRPLIHLDKLKRDKLLDILRRAVANPQNLGEVASEIALDWFPTMTVDKEGNWGVIIGSGNKK